MNQQKKGEKEIRLNINKPKKQNKKVEEFKKDYNKYNHQLQRRKKTTKLQKKKQYELKKKNFN